MNSIKCLALLVKSSGHDVGIRKYTKPGDGRVIYYITNIDDKTYYTYQQKEAKNELLKIAEAEGIDEDR